MQRNGSLLPLFRDRAILGLRILFWVLLLTLSCAADEFWNLLQQGRPGLARQHLKSPTLLQLAQIAQAEGDIGGAWLRVRQLEAAYKPGQQPAEFFWLRAQLLGFEQWNLASQNLRGVLETSRSQELRLLALCMQAEGLARQKLDSEASEARLQASLLANQMGSRSSQPWMVHLALAQARQQLSDAQPAQALATLVAARGLARWPGLAALVELQVAECHAQLADWKAFDQQCRTALQWVRKAPEPWLVKKVCSFWVHQLVQRSSDRQAVEACFRALSLAEKWFDGAARLEVLSELAVLQALALNQNEAALATLGRALELCRPGKRRLWFLAECYILTPEAQKASRRRWLLAIHKELGALGPVQPEDPISNKLPRFGIWAAVAETYLPQEPDKADSYFAKALAASGDRHARLRVLSYQLGRHVEAGLMNRARQSMKNLLEQLHSGPMDSMALAVVRSQMVELNRSSRFRTRLLLRDELHPPAESSVAVLLEQLLRDEKLQSMLERDILKQIRESRTPQDFARAYLARVQLLLAQKRGLEAGLAAVRMAEVAEQGGLPLHQALALKTLAEIRWSLGLYTWAMDSVTRAEQLYAVSGNPQDRQQAQECKLLRAYFLMHGKRTQEALQLCGESQEPWFVFLKGRCYLELGERGKAESALLQCVFEDEFAEVGRLALLARCSLQPDIHFAEAYRRARQMGSIAAREIALDWIAWLRQQGQEKEALQLEKEAQAWLSALFGEYPAEVREQLLDQPLTQKLLHRTAQPQVTEVSPRQSRRIFLARVNQVRERYPRLDNELPISAADLVSLQETIPEDRVVVQYFAAEADLYAMRIDDQGCHLIQLAVEKEVLKDSVEKIRHALSRRQPLPEIPARRLYLSLVQSLGPGLEGKQIQVVPGGFLWYLPWDVLQDMDGKYLVEKLDWSCLAPSELLRSRFREPRAGTGALSMVALGGADPDLPATANEARHVASLFPGATALVGAQATSDKLIEFAPQADILHVASHSGLSQHLNQIYIELSDGPFRLEKIYGLNLRPESRVILSSCESALGQMEPGREVSSLATAFLASGASSVVATLWKVEDQTSEAFFRRFYPNLIKLGSSSKALRQTRLECLADPALKAPWGWGAYQLYGEP